MFLAIGPVKKKCVLQMQFGLCTFFFVSLLCKFHMLEIQIAVANKNSNS